MNNLIIMGRLTAAPEQKTSKTGKRIATFTVAVDRKTAEKQTDFFRCVAFDRAAENIERFFGKGSRILCRGSMQSDTYEKNGEKRTAWSMIVNEFDFCESRDTQPEPKQKAADFADVADDIDFPF